MLQRYSKTDRVFLLINGVLLTAFLILIAYPLLFVIFAAFSGGASGMSLLLIPEKWSLEGYRAVFEYKYIWIGYRNSLFYMLLGTALALCVTVLCAYPLSRKEFVGRGFFMGMCVFTMYFGGGLIPTYLWIRQLGLFDSFWAILLPASPSVYNMIVMRTYFCTQIPQELLEASYLDGCGDIRYLCSVVLPLSGSLLAVIGLYYAVSLWNAYFGPLIYLQTRTSLPLSVFLREILVYNDLSGLDSGALADSSGMEKMERRAEIMKYAVIVISSLPVMALYPFVQKYFVKGVMIGAVKG